MESKAKLAGHAVHPMLITLPLGLLGTAVIFDIIRAFTDSTDLAVASFYMIAAGIIGGLAAAVFGLVDYLAIPRGTRAKTIGAFHGLANLVIVGLYIASWGIRYADAARQNGGAVLLSGIAVLLALVSGWLGGELVDRLGVGVDDGAHVDAPSSLSGRPAREKWTPPRPLEPKRA
jgi:uncharacterized membrane protein